MVRISDLQATFLTQDGVTTLHPEGTKVRLALDHGVVSYDISDSPPVRSGDSMEVTSTVDLDDD